MARNMRICFFISGFGDGGAQKQCIKLANCLGSNTRVDLHIVRFHEGVHDPLLRSDGISIHKLSTRSNYDPRNITDAAEVIKRINPDIVLSWLQACDVYSFFIKKMIPKVCWILNERDSYYPNNIKFNIRRFLGRYADAIIANSEPGRRYWEKNGAKGDVFVVSNIVDQSPRFEAQPSRDGAVVHVGRLEPQKNIKTTTDAFCRIAASRPDIIFQIIGHGGLQQDIETLIAQSGVDNVRLVGFRSDAPSLIGSASALVTLSHHEGTPNVVLEAVAQGTPVVASDILEHRAILGPSYPFYVADRDDPDACVEVLERLLASDTAGSALSFAQDRLRAMTPETVSASYLSIFETTLAKTKR